MGNSSSSNNLQENTSHNEILNKIQNLLGGSETENFLNNEGAQQYMNKISNLLQESEMNLSNKYNAVTGDTENLSNSSINNMMIETSENLVPVFKLTNNMYGGIESENFVPVFKLTNNMSGGIESENLVSVFKLTNNMDGGSGNSILNQISNLLQDTEVSVGNVMNGGLNNNITGQISNLLQDTEGPIMNGGDSIKSHFESKLTSLLEETEMNNFNNTTVNLRGGALDSQNMFGSDEDENNLKKKHRKNSLSTEEKKEEKEETKEETKEEETKEEIENSPEESVAEESEQSGGVELDTELKNILMTLKKENSGSKQNSISGGKGKSKGKKSQAEMKKKELIAA